MPLYEEERAIVAKVRTNEEIKGELAREVDLAIAKAVRRVLKRHGMPTTPPQAQMVATALGFLRRKR